MLSDKPEEKPVATVEDDDEDDGEELNADYTPEELEEIYAEEQTYEAETKYEQKKGSPMYQHYQTVKEKYKDCIVLYRLGDFYEMFGEDAIASANELNLTLTGRDCGLAERVPMTGIPYHAADVYISKLVSRSYKVAVAEPLEGKSERTVERVIAPKQSESEPLADEEIYTFSYSFFSLQIIRRGGTPLLLAILFHKQFRLKGEFLSSPLSYHSATSIRKIIFECLKYDTLILEA